MEQALAGQTYQQIADDMGYANRGTVYRIVKSVLRHRQVESVDELRELELDRLDALQAAYYGKAIRGDMKAAGLVLRVIDRRARILGLYDNHEWTDQRSEHRVISPDQLGVACLVLPAED